MTTYTLLRMATDCVRWVEAMFGVVLLCTGFLYEKEEARIQGWLQDLWIQLDDRRAGHAAIKHFVLACGRQSQVVLDRVFGQSSISLRSLGISFSFAVASYLLAMKLGRQPNTHDAAWFLASIVGVCLCTIYPTKLITLLAFFSPTYYVTSLLLELYKLPIAKSAFELSSISFLLGIIFASIFDYLWVAAHRKFIAIAVENHWSVSLAIGLLVSGLVCGTPFLLLLTDHFSSNVYNSELLYNLRLFASVLLSTRLLMAAAAAVFFLVMASALLYKPLHLLISRGVYFLQRHEVIRKHRVLAFVGVFLILDALGLERWLSPLQQLF